MTTLAVRLDARARPCQTFHEGLQPVAKSVEMRLKVRPPFPVDLLVRTPEMLREPLAPGDLFIRSILEEGKVLYDAVDH